MNESILIHPDAPSHEKRKLGNDIQIELMKRAFKVNKETNPILQEGLFDLDWIEQNAKVFSEIFNDMHLENPQFIENFYNNKEEVLSVIEEKLSFPPQVHDIAA